MSKNESLALSISMVVPVYNGEDTVISEIKKAKKILDALHSDYEIIIGDDKSTDQTRDLLIKEFKKSNKIKLILNKTNLGIAENIKNLYSKARKNYVLFFVADGDWETKSVKQLLSTLKKTHADIVIGKRNNKRGYTLYRNIISFLHNTLPFILFGVHTVDAGSLKIYKRQYVQRSEIKSTSVFLDAEIIIRASKNGAEIVTTPIVYRKPFTTSGVAAKPSVVLESLKDLLRLRLSLL